MSSPPTLLLADDSVTIQRIVSLSFADQPVRVVVARDGQDAINRMTTDRPDLVLADTNMPCVDGYELARWMRRQPHLSTVPVLLLAGATDPVNEQRLQDSGANGVLEKPFESSHVISRVKELLGLKSAPPAPTRLVTTPEARPVRRPPQGPLPPPAAVARAPEPPPAPEMPAAGSAPPVVREALNEPFVAERSIDELFDSLDARMATRDDPQALGDRLDAAGGGVGREPAAPPVMEAADDWFPDGGRDRASRAELAAEMGLADLAFYGDGEVPRRPLHAEVPDSRGDGPVGPGPRSTSAADAFDTLLAAEQGEAAAASPAIGRVAVPGALPAITDEMLDGLAARVVERLQPHALRDELQRSLGFGLRDAVVQSVRGTMETETRAAVAEAVQAAVNGTILGTVRGAVNEAVAAAVPAAVEQQVSARVEPAVRSSAAEVLGAAVEPIVRDVLGGHVSALVRDTLARDLREVVVPEVQQIVGATLAAAVRQAVAEAVPAAVLEAVRGDAGGMVRQVVQETSERLVREEIARIRERRTGLSPDHTIVPRP